MLSKIIKTKDIELEYIELRLTLYDDGVITIIDTLNDFKTHVNATYKNKKLSGTGSKNMVTILNKH